MFILWRVMPQQYMYRHFTLSAEGISQGRVHTLITSIFSHTSVFHLAFNMLAVRPVMLTCGGRCQSYSQNHPWQLHSFAPVAFIGLGGVVPFLTMYGVAGLVGSTAFVALQRIKASRTGDPWHLQTPGLGASGAVYSVLAYGILARPRAQLLIFFIPMPAYVAGLLLAGYSVYGLLDNRSQVGHAAHLGGIVVGAIAYAMTRGRVRFL